MALPIRLAPRKESNSSGNSVRISKCSAAAGGDGGPASASVMIVDGYDDPTRLQIHTLQKVPHRRHQDLVPFGIDDLQHVLRPVPEAAAHHAARLAGGVHRRAADE